MKRTIGALTLGLGLLLGCMQGGGVQAQVVPTTPTKFGKRSLGTGTGSDGAVTAGVSQQAAKAAEVRHLTYLTLSEARQWTRQADGKAIVAKLIAWEQIELKLQAGETVPVLKPEDVPKNPTVIRDGKIRVLMNQQPYELELGSLTEQDQQFVRELKVQAPDATQP